MAREETRLFPSIDIKSLRQQWITETQHPDFADEGITEIARVTDYRIHREPVMLRLDALILRVYRIGGGECLNA